MKIVLKKLLALISIILILGLTGSFLLVYKVNNRLIKEYNTSKEIIQQLQDKIQEYEATTENENPLNIEKEKLKSFITYRNYKVYDTLSNIIIESSIKYGNEYNVPYKLLIFVMDVESDFRPDVVSKAGAIGLMQVMPKVWINENNKNNLQQIGITKSKQLFDPEINIKAGSYILSIYMKQCNNDYSCALKKYFGGSYNSYYEKIKQSAGEYFFFKNKMEEK